MSGMLNPWTTAEAKIKKIIRQNDMTSSQYVNGSLYYQFINKDDECGDNDEGIGPAVLSFG